MRMGAGVVVIFVFVGRFFRNRKRVIVRKTLKTFGDDDQTCSGHKESGRDAGESF